MWSLAFIDYLEYSEIVPLDEEGINRQSSIPFNYFDSTYREVTI
jgi:hypothetical protein